MPTERWLAAPLLLAPENGASFQGWNADVVLQWSPEPGLRADEYYVVRIPYDAAGNTAEFWRKETAFRVPPNFSQRDVGFADRHYNWTVQVFRCTASCDAIEDDNVRKQGIAVGSASTEGLFFWYSFGGGLDPRPTATPPATPPP
jgi:hypothetical protein